MADFDNAFNIVQSLEFSNRGNALHKNANESALTFCGLYRIYTKDLVLWNAVDKGIASETNTKILSRQLCDNSVIMAEVKETYRREYWNKPKLNFIHSDQVAFDIFVAGVNMGQSKAVKIAQEILELTPDGVIGPISIKKINECDEIKFSRQYDIKEIQYYKKLVEKNPDFRRFLAGWISRANRV